MADVETLDVGYPDLFRLVSDLRGMAATNILHQRVALTRSTLAATAEAFAAQADTDGRIRERFNIIYLTGWAPDPSQPRAARRGSATASLAAALSPPISPSSLPR